MRARSGHSCGITPQVILCHGYRDAMKRDDVTVDAQAVVLSIGGLLFPMVCEPAESRYAERNARVRCGVSARGGHHANADRRPPGELQFHQFDRSFHILPSVMKAAATTIEVTLTTAMRLLIIEDERRTAAHLQKGLSENGFTVDVAYNGFEGFELARTGDYALIVLDVMLPHRDGWTILDELRRASVLTPVLFLTARDRVEDRIKGLEMGADDYLVKPYSFSELLARVRTILRRGPAMLEEVLRIADLEIDTRRCRVVRQGRTLQLTRREFLLLTCLARSVGEVVSRTRIVEQVWDINFDTGTNIVEATMRRLRAKGDDPFEKPLIHNVRGIGYVLESR